MKGKIRRHSLIEIIEHWSVAISGMVLLFTGLGCLPLYKRYFVSEIPGFGWTADFNNVTMVHYMASLVFVSAVMFHIFYHSLRREFGLIPKRGDVSRGIKVIGAMLGFGEEPPSEKYLPEQRIAYAGIGSVILVLTVTGIVKVLKNLEWIVLPPSVETVNTLLHTLFGLLFMLAFFVHVGVVLLFKANWPLLKSMFTGYVDEEYVKRRHALWCEELKKSAKEDSL